MQAVRVKQGKYQIVECTPRKQGQTDEVTPLSPWIKWTSKDFSLEGIKATTAQILANFNKETSYELKNGELRVTLSEYDLYNTSIYEQLVFIRAKYPEYDTGHATRTEYGWLAKKS